MPFPRSYFITLRVRDSPEPKGVSKINKFPKFQKRIGLIGIIVKNRKKNASLVNKTLSDFGEIIIGRMGIPNKSCDIGLISIFVEGTTDEIGALTGRLGSIKGVTVKSMIISPKNYKKLKNLKNKRSYECLKKFY
ncbi:MAG: Aspartate ammonia-lyase [Thermodesulfobacterium sp.]|uniref:Aspartate ammonia-lyase n=1 Tax=Candidatus Thermodesulfobacterium syntrophicum TaxID=3060442 RepID=A0AAE3TDH1_9BACT|nr:Aspartate ammonia-lyase [Candidatus Thermodesulfobacterium syntrophicum]